MSDSPREKDDFEAYNRELAKLKQDMKWHHQIQDIKSGRLARFTNRTIQSLQEFDDSMRRCEGNIEDVSKQISDATLASYAVHDGLRSDMMKHTKHSIDSSEVALRSEFKALLEALKKEWFGRTRKQQRQSDRCFADLERQTETRLQVFGVQVADSQHETIGQVAVLKARIESLENSHQMSNIIAFFFALTFVLMLLCK